MNFKFKRPRKSRAGCGLCKPHKKCASHKLGHYGFGKLRREAAALHDLKEARMPT